MQDLKDFIQNDLNAAAEAQNQPNEGNDGNESNTNTPPTE